MFDGIRQWLEGLFRPVIRVIEGHSYIARTPTIFDYRQWNAPQYVKGSVVVGAANGIYLGEWHTFAYDCLLLGGTVDVGISTRSATHDIGTTDSYVRSVFSTVAGAASGTTPIFPSAETLSRVIKRGEGVRIAVQNNSGVGATSVYTLRIVELKP